MSDKNIDWLKRLQILDKALEENGVRTNFCVDTFGKIGYRPDFSKHDKRFNDEIESLKRQIEKLESIRTRCRESARDSFDSGNYGCLHIVTADELKTTKDVNDRTVELPFDPLETANMLINATYKTKIPFLERQVDRKIYDIDDLEQIAEVVEKFMKKKTYLLQVILLINYIARTN